MAKIYAVISGKGGVGKTTSTINLGSSINELGNDVIIVEGNLTTPNIGVYLGAPIVPVSVNHVLNGQAKAEDAIYEHESGTKIMPASLSLREKVNYRDFKDLMRRLRKMTDHVLIDCAAGLGEEARSSMSVADEIIIITNPEMSAVTDALKTIKLAEELNKQVLGVIVTRYSGKRMEMAVPNIKDMLEVPILGIIPEADAVKESHVMKNPVVLTHPKSKVAKTYRTTSRRILGEDIAIEPPIKLGFFSQLMKGLGLKG